MIDPKLDQILTAATDLFLEVGFAAASMDAVAKRARVSKTTLYTRFPSKELLLAACVSAVCEASGGAMAPEAFDDVDMVTALEQVGEAMLGLIWSPTALRGHQIIVGENPRMPGLARTYYDAGPGRTVAFMVALFERSVALGKLSVSDPAFAARQFIGTLAGHIDFELHIGLRPPPDEAERRDYVKKTVRLFLEGAGKR